MKDSTFTPTRTYALVVGIEKYALGSGSNLDGAAHDASTFAGFLVNWGVPKENIALLLSPLDHNTRLLDEWPASSQWPATRQGVSDVVTQWLPKQSGDLLWVFWGGHGVITATRKRKLFYADTTSVDWYHLDVESLLTRLSSDNLPGFQQQIYLIDTCANYKRELSQERLGDGDRFPSGEPVRGCEQFVFFATQEGEVAKNLDQEQTGLFSKMVLEELAREPSTSWPPDMEKLAGRVRASFSDPTKAGKTTQTPIFASYRTWDGREYVFGQQAEQAPPLWNIPFAYNPYVTGREERRAARRAQRVRSALEKYKNKYGPSFSPASLDARIQLEYVDIANPWDRRSSIVDIYQKNTDKFLLLGRVGSGKSTSMKELTLMLIESELRKQGNVENINFPVFLPLREWFAKKKPIKAWLTDYLTNREHARLGLDRQLIQYWAREGRFILLLDGLDDMSEEDSRKCLMAIHKWGQETNFSPLIISCQLDRYEALREDECFFEAGVTAVMIQKLSDSQVHDYLEQKKKPELSHFLYQDEKGQRLKRLVDTPLLLNFLVLATTGKDFKQQISEIDTEDDVFKKYINRYIDDKKLYSGHDARYWLIRLARHMGNNSTFSFQSGNLPREKAARSLYTNSTRFILCLSGVAACMLVMFGGFPLWQLLLLLAIIAGFYGYLWKSILTEFYMLLLYTFTLLFPSFSLESTRGKTRRQQVMEVLIALVVLFFPLILLGVLAFLLEWITGIPLWLVILVAWLLGGLFWYVFYQLRNFSLFLRLTERSLVLETWFALRDLLVFRQVDDPLPLEKLSPKLSRKLITGMLLGIAAGLMICIIGHILWQANLLAVALLVGMSIWLDRGLGASIRGYLLRFWFWWAGILPWTTAFLDDVARGKILVKQGNRYKFSHNALKEHLAKRMPSQK